MVYCTEMSWLSHDIIPLGTPCPFCSHSAGATAPTAPVTPATTVVVSPTTPATATFIPAGSQTVNPLTAARTGRNTAITISQAAVTTRPAAATPSPNKVILAMKVGHAVFKGTSPALEFIPFQESWECEIVSNVAYTTYTLTQHLVADSRNVNAGLGYWTEVVWPAGEGEWQLKIGHITSAKACGKWVRPWEGSLTIEHIVTKLNLSFHSTKERIYDMTILWMPERFPRESSPIQAREPSIEQVPGARSSTLQSVNSMLRTPHADRPKRPLSIQLKLTEEELLAARRAAREAQWVQIMVDIAEDERLDEVTDPVYAAKQQAYRASLAASKEAATPKQTTSRKAITAETTPKNASAAVEATEQGDGQLGAPRRSGRARRAPGQHE